MNFKFKDFFFQNLSPQVQLQDTHVNADGEGLTQRYLQAFGLELDEEVVPFIEEFTNILDLETTPEKFLPFIAYQLGSPPNILNTPQTFRKILGQIVNIYKIKGTECSYQLLFNLLGLNLLISIQPNQAPTLYDEGSIYDNNKLYDISCGQCIKYDIIYWSQSNVCSTGSITQVDESILRPLEKIICLLQPIDTKLGSLIPGVNLCENLEPEVDQELTIETEDLSAYDTPTSYDNGYLFDSNLVSATNTYNF